LPEPVNSPWGARLRERTQPLQPDDDQYGWAHAILCEALAQPFLQVAELTDPEDPMPPWGPLFDVDSCPAWALPWLAQAVGAVVSADVDEESARASIKAVAGQAAGTTRSMYSAMLPTLTGDAPTVFFRERDGSAYRLEVVTLTSETPNPTATLNALLMFKPGGLVLAFRQVVGWDYQAQTDAGGTYAQQTTKFSTYQRQSENRPG
jgi:hypothetical protein